MATPKETARQLIEHLPDQATWDDIMYELYLMHKVEAGLRAGEEGRTISHEEIKPRLLAKKRHAWPDHLPATGRATANSHRAARQPQSRGA